MNIKSLSIFIATMALAVSCSNVKEDPMGEGTASFTATFNELNEYFWKLHLGMERQYI